MSHLTFVGEGRTLEEHGAYLSFLNNGIVGFYLVNTFLTQTDVQYAQLSYKRLVLREEESQFRLLKCQRKIGMDDIGTDIISIVLRHQTGGYVNGHNIRSRTVNVLDQGGKTACQRLVESRTEKSVNHQHSFFQVGRIEFLRYFCKVLSTSRCLLAAHSSER